MMSVTKEGQFPQDFPTTLTALAEKVAFRFETGGQRFGNFLRVPAFTAGVNNQNLHFFSSFADPTAMQ